MTADQELYTQILQLPHVSERPLAKNQGTLDYWSTKNTGNYADDCDVGTSLAKKALSIVRDNNDKFPLVHIVKEMIAKGKFTGVEVGFLSTIAKHILP